MGASFARSLGYSDNWISAVCLRPSAHPFPKVSWWANGETPKTKVLSGVGGARPFLLLLFYLEAIDGTDVDTFCFFLLAFE